MEDCDGITRKPLYEGLSFVPKEGGYSKWLNGILKEKGHPKEKSAEFEHDMFDFLTYCSWGVLISKVLAGVKDNDVDGYTCAMTSLFSDRIQWVRCGKTNHVDDDTALYELTTDISDRLNDKIAGLLKVLDLPKDYDRWYRSFINDGVLKSSLKKWLDIADGRLGEFEKGMKDASGSKNYIYLDVAIKEARRDIGKVRSSFILGRAE